MKAVQYDKYGLPDVLTLRQIDAPVPRAGEVLIRVNAASVAPGDCKTRAGKLQRFFSVSFPKIPGRYGSGVIVALGADVDYVRTGDVVVFAAEHTENGCCAEYMVRTREKIALAPTNVTFAEAAAVIHEGMCAAVCIATGKIGRDTRVLVHGAAGAVGGACVQLAHHLGATVTATCREHDRLYVGGLGAHRVVAFDREDFSQAASNQDVVVDTQGGEVHQKSYRVLRRGGRLVYLNAAPIEDRGAEHGVEVVNAPIEDRHCVLDAVCRLVRQGALKPRVARILPLAEAAEAHRLVEGGMVKRGRVVLSIA